MRPPAQAEGGPACAGRCDARIAVAWLGQAVGKVGRRRREGLASECPIQGGQPHRGGKAKTPGGAGPSRAEAETTMRRSHEQQS